MNLSIDRSSDLVIRVPRNDAGRGNKKGVAVCNPFFVIYSFDYFNIANTALRQTNTPTTSMILDIADA